MSAQLAVNPQWWWYLSRASGLVAWAVLTAALVWGALLATKLPLPRVRPPWMLDLHRWLGGTALVLVGVHLAALVADSYVHITVRDLLVPFGSSYKPLALAVGVLGFYLLLAVQLSSLAMRRIPTRWWRWVHMSSYLLVFVVSVHGALAGTDVLRGFYRFVAAALVVTPVVVIVMRVARRRPRSVPQAAPAAVPVPTRLPSP